MGRRGPKPTPTAILKMRGSWRAKEREKAGEVTPPLVTRMPRPPAFLKRHGRREWKRVVTELMRMGVLADIELTGLAMHVCKPLDDYWQFDAAIAEHGLLVTGSTGATVRNPLIISRNQALAQHMRGCAEFGLTPADRPKLTRDGAESHAAATTPPAGKKKAYF